MQKHVQNVTVSENGRHKVSEGCGKTFSRTRESMSLPGTWKERDVKLKKKDSLSP